MMKAEKALTALLRWLPSLIVILFYLPVALNKLFEPHQTGKIVESGAVMITAGIFLLVAIILFLNNKTIVFGTTLLVVYMTCVVFIHMYREKPAEVVMLILIATIFAAKSRKPALFHRQE